MPYSFWDRLISLFFPCRCVLCARVVAYETLWCGTCPLPFSPRIQAISPLSGSIAPFLYQDSVRQAILLLKKRNDARTAAFFAHYIFQSISETGIQFDAVVPVPMHASRRIKKGYNQTESIAVPLAKQMGVPVILDALARHDTTRDQHGLSYLERIENAQNSYFPTFSHPLDGLCILLVDDVYTTGATAATCAQCLMQQGAVQIWVATATRVASLANQTALHGNRSLERNLFI